MRVHRSCLVAAIAMLAVSAPFAKDADMPHGIDLAGIDHAVKPGDDFFDYANGSWIKTNEIPADRSSWGSSAILSELNSKRLRELIENAAGAKAPESSDTQKVGDYYASYMDEAGIEAKGMTPIKADLDRIAAIKDKAELSAYLGTTLRADVDALNATNFYTDNIFGVWISQALDDPGRTMPYLLQGGLGMPDRDYYTSDSPKMAELRIKYRAHIAALLKLAGSADAEAKAGRIFDLEMKIAKAHWPRVESEDVHKANNTWQRTEFAAKAPGLDWNAYFEAAGLAEQPRFILWQPSAIIGISALVGSESVQTWKDYLQLRLLDHNSGLLPKAFVDENFAFYGTALYGTPAIRDRWKRAVTATNGAIGEVVGRLYVEKYFPPESKAKIEAMVQDLIRAYRVRIEKLAWMTPQTKEKALAKLATLKVGVGYPDKWQDYSTLSIVRGDAYGNARRAQEFAYKQALAKLGKAPDRGEWVMTPQTVNAVNLPMANALNFPAAILQPPFFDAEADAAVNFGAIGSIIGHEISHSFDDQGSQFDAQGRLVNWWTPEDARHFEEASARLADQFSAYRPFPDLAVNGKQTLSENISDVAGLSAAHDAYLLSLGGKPAATLQGLSGDQRFFLAFAQAWRSKLREGALRSVIVTDGHAPGMYRADTVRNLDVWYPAFAVKPGQKLYLAPEQRVRVW